MKERRPIPSPKPHAPLLDELRGLIEAAREHVAQTANAALTMLYWHMASASERKCCKTCALNTGPKLWRRCRSNW